MDGGEELQHHGILGMKWGVRRYQNKDGTRTLAGKKRYANKDTPATEPKAESREERKARVIASRSARELYKNADAFDTNELRAQYDRLRLEKDIKNLDPVKVKDGAYYIKKAVDLSASASALAQNASKIAVSYSVIRKAAEGNVVATGNKK